MAAIRGPLMPVSGLNADILRRKFEVRYDPYSVVKRVLLKNGATLIRQRTQLNKNGSFHPEVRFDKYVLAPAK